MGAQRILVGISSPPPITSNDTLATAGGVGQGWLRTRVQVQQASFGAVSMVSEGMQDQGAEGAVTGEGRWVLAAAGESLWSPPHEGGRKHQGAEGQEVGLVTQGMISRHL